MSTILVTKTSRASRVSDDACHAILMAGPQSSISFTQDSVSCKSRGCHYLRKDLTITVLARLGRTKSTLSSLVDKSIKVKKCTRHILLQKRWVFLKRNILLK